MTTYNLNLKLQATAMTLLMVATCLAATPNQTLLQAYTRHAIQASQDLAQISTRLDINDKAILSDHLIRIGRHLQLINDNLDNLEKTILNNEAQFVHGDWTTAFATLEAKLHAMGFRGHLHNPDAAHRAKIFASIKMHGLKRHLQITGAAVELKGAQLVSPYARLDGLILPASFNPVPARLRLWTFVGEGWMALGAVAMLGVATAPLGTALAAAGGFMWLTATLFPALC